MSHSPQHALSALQTLCPTPTHQHSALIMGDSQHPLCCVAQQIPFVSTPTLPCKSRCTRRKYSRPQVPSLPPLFTGIISGGVYDEACYFADPTIAFRGLQRWRSNLQLLVPFLEDASVELLSLERTGSDPDGAPLLLVNTSVCCQIADTA